MNGSPPAVPTAKNSGLAIWSLVLGIMAIACFLGPVVGIPAIICGHIALSRIKRSAGTLTGGGLAIGGLVTGYFSFAMIPVIGLLAAIAIPNFVRARETAQANACINNMRAIDSAVHQWALEAGKREDDAIDPIGVSKYVSGVMPTCPVGGIYELAPTVGTSPSVRCPNEVSGAKPMHRLPTP